MMKALIADLRHPDILFVWAYRVEQEFFENLFGEFMKDNEVRILCDYTTRHTVAAVVAKHPKAVARHWAKNAMLHSKVILFRQRGILYLGSHNFTRYAWVSAQNMTLRVENKEVCERVYEKFNGQWFASKIIVPDEILHHVNLGEQAGHDNSPVVSLGEDVKRGGPA